MDVCRLEMIHILDLFQGASNVQSFWYRRFQQKNQCVQTVQSLNKTIVRRTTPLLSGVSLSTLESVRSTISPSHRVGNCLFLREWTWLNILNIINTDYWFYSPPGVFPAGARLLVIIIVVLPPSLSNRRVLISPSIFFFVVLRLLILLYSSSTLFFFLLLLLFSFP